MSVRLCVTNTALLIRQTLLVQIFAPLARLLGLYSIKEELEELSFQFSNPEAHGQMVKRIRVLSETQHDVVQAVSHSHLSRFAIEHVLARSLTQSFTHIIELSDCHYPALLCWVKCFLSSLAVWHESLSGRFCMVLCKKDASSTNSGRRL